jgi:hypothetical protein
MSTIDIVAVMLLGTLWASLHGVAARHMCLCPREYGKVQKESSMRSVIVILVVLLIVGCQTPVDEGILADSMLSNGDFSNQLRHWTHFFNLNAAGSVEVVEAQLQVEITSIGTTTSGANVQVHQNGLNLIEGQEYRVEFDAWSSVL